MKTHTIRFVDIENMFGGGTTMDAHAHCALHSKLTLPYSNANSR